MGGSIGSAASKVGDFITGSGDQVAGTGQSVQDLKDIGYSPTEIASMGGPQMTTAQKIAKGITGVAGAGMQGVAQPQQPQQPRPGGSQIQVAPTPDVSAYFPVRPLTITDPRFNPADPNSDPYSAFFRR